MQKLPKLIAILMLIVAVSAMGCKKTQKTAYDKPVVETSPVHEITGTSALGGGVVVSASGGEIIERGVCWGLQSNPTIDGNHAKEGTGMGSFTRGMSGLEQTTTYHVRAYATNSLGTGYGSDVTFTTTLEHGYVDFNLPDGVLWATYNLGSNAPEEEGELFSWGETETKDYFGGFWDGWDYYKYACGQFVVSKYTSNEEFNCSGIVDGLYTLEPCDDAATVNWGKGWRMPTYREWRNLYNGTIQSWTTQNGVLGMLFTACGDSLFLPATTLNIYDSTYRCGYWSSSLHISQHWGAEIFYEGKDDPWSLMSWSDRYVGLPIRPVRSERKGHY
ncbi:MAG: hypothetical protein J6P83_10510 [Bacteroidales bacterium]|nr:hypothetical protein [Bacteroidales bacterium]